MNGSSRIRMREGLENNNREWTRRIQKLIWMKDEQMKKKIEEKRFQHLKLDSLAVN